MSVFRTVLILLISVQRIAAFAVGGRNILASWTGTRFYYVLPRSLRSSDELAVLTFSVVMADKTFSVSASQICNELCFRWRAASSVSSYKRRRKCELFATALSRSFSQTSHLSRL